MIYLNNYEVDVNHFTDGSQKLVNVIMPEYNARHEVHIRWNYESDEEAMTLYFLVNHLREHGYDRIVLKVAYMPHGRMDRIKSEREVFTLKWMCKFINDLHFEQVHVLDPHSNVMVALLDRVYLGGPQRHIREIIDGVGFENIVLHFPDWGAYKRTEISMRDIPACYGYKTRNWDTGKIESLQIENLNNVDLTTKTVLIIDDIVAKGDTMVMNALKLKEMGAKRIIAYASHTENTILEQKNGFMKLLEDGTIDHLVTTDSIFTGDHPKIIVHRA
jgi:ribose-phosphate pyrophosphokinase